MADGVFAEWQPRYAEAGIPTFPIRANKKPAISGYMKTGPGMSAKLLAKFGAAPGLGFVCKKAGLAVLDVDTPDENIFADALALYGDSPIKIRSGGGNFQAWYRYNGEGRKIRPDKSKPIDILGGGMVVAPPTQGGAGTYQFLSGSLDDIASLPVLRLPETVNDPAPSLAAPVPDLVGVGRRNDALWRACMRHAKACGTFDNLLRFAHDVSAEMMAEALDDDEVMKIASSAWEMTAKGKNRFGAPMLIGMPAPQFERIADPFALMLFMKLRQRWRDGETFHVANVMAESMPGGWPRKRFAAARLMLERAGLLVMVRPPIKGEHGGPAIYRFG